MILFTQINCPICGSYLVVDLMKNTFICQRCFISYKNNEKMTRFLANQPVKIVKISEGEIYENQKTGQSIT